MIVVDTNIIVYLYLPTAYTEKTELLLKTDPVWKAPLLWRSEFRNVLALYIRQQLLTLEQAIIIQKEAEDLMENSEYEINSLDVLRLVEKSECSAYDCEFIALAQFLGVKLITGDKKIVREFPETASSINSFPD